MDSILVSYTDGVLNIDRTDAGREGERDGEALHSFFFPLKVPLDYSPASECVE